MPNLRPFRDYSEHDVINLYSCDIVASKGTLVKPIRSPRYNGGALDGSNASPLTISSNAAGATFPNSINNLFDLVGQVTPTVNWDDAPAPIGMLLYSVAEYDENGEKLINNPRKAAEMNVILPKVQAAPILTKGIVLVNDIDTSNRGGGGGNPDLGDFAYVGDAGKIGTDGTVVVGRFLSKKDENGYCIVKLSL